MSDGTLDFSFSGMKTAVLRYVQANGIRPVSSGTHVDGHAAASKPRELHGHATTDVLPASNGGGAESPARDLQQVPAKVLDLLASFQESLVQYLIDHTIKAARLHQARSIGLSGGVACNSRLREAARQTGERLGIPVFYPSPLLTTDNGAMIASAGYHHLIQGRTAGYSLNADPGARL
jgi:N6-L-threonylcarbamoyladenine synthase